MGTATAKKIDPVLEELVSIVGEGNASDAKHIRYAYSYDLSFVQPKLPDYVAMATEVEEIQEILRMANRLKIPVVPYTGGTNIGGLTIPERGGILLDLKNMNRIIDIDPLDGVAVIEPGVSHAQLASELTKLGLRFGWPVGPPSASVSSCCISHGIGGLNARSLAPHLGRPVAKIGRLHGFRVHHHESARPSKAGVQHIVQIRSFAAYGYFHAHMAHLLKKKRPALPG